MLIHVNRIYETVTEESAADGEAAESGYMSEGDACTFRELVELMRDHPQASCYPLPADTAGGYRVWFSSYPEFDFRTGEEITYSIHLADTGPRAYRYWLKAARFARCR